MWGHPSYRSLVSISAILLWAAASSEEASPLAAVAVTSSPQRNPVSIYLTGRTGVEPLSEADMGSRLQELTPVAAQAATTFLNVINPLIKLYGDNANKWPSQEHAQWEAQNRLFALACRPVQEVVWFGGNTQKDIDDSVRDLRNQLQKKKKLQLVDTPDAAVLLVEVRGRGWAPADDVFGTPRVTHSGKGPFTSFVSLKVSAAPTLSLPAERADALMWYRANNYEITWRRLDTDPLQWHIEVSFHTWTVLTQHTWGIAHKSATNSAAFAIENFVDKNYDVLEAGRRQ